MEMTTLGGWNGGVESMWSLWSLVFCFVCFGSWLWQRSLLTDGTVMWISSRVEWLFRY